MSRLIYVADCETDPFKPGRIPAPFIWGLYDGAEYWEFNTTDDFVDFVSQREGIVYAHNGGKFDWHYLLHRLKSFDPIMLISGRLSKFKIGKMEFRDSYNILPTPLSAFKKDDFDYNLLEKENRDVPENRAKISAYLKSDCINLREYVMEFVGRYGVNLTIAGTALKEWKRISGHDVPVSTKAFYSDFKPFYYGGRVECFESGVIDRNFKVIDINSAYPYGMTHDHPWGFDFVKLDDLPRSGVEQCFIELEGCSRGALPFRDEIGGELIFPDDDLVRRYTVTGWEYVAAVDTGSLVDCKIIAVYQFLSTINFASYASEFFAQKSSCKLSGDSAGYIFAKLFLNSLYGKFAACPEKYEENIVLDPRMVEMLEADPDEDYRYSAEANEWAIMARPLPDGKANYHNVATAASITGFVRAQLWRALCECDSPIYCDTDSIACNGVNALKIDPVELGAWDVEADCVYGGVAGKKLYAFMQESGQWKTASKGVRFSPEQIMRVVKGEAVTDTPLAPSYSIKRGTRFINRTITKTVV